MSQLKVDTITDEAGTGSPDFPNGVSGDGSGLSGVVKTSGDQSISGTITATGFVGNGAGLTNLPAPPSTANFQQFTSSGTWTKPAGVSFVYVQAIGGGGSGGCCRVDSGGAAGSGGGGGAGVEALFLATSVGSTVTVTIGAGGASVVRTSSGNSNGNTGGNTTFGTLVTAQGGTGGEARIVNQEQMALGGLNFFASAVPDLRSPRALGSYGGGSGGNAFGISTGSSAQVGGNAILGGGGGGGATRNTNLTRAGGVSILGGNGGAGGNTTGGNGVAPGGGGGGAAQVAGTVTSGAGAAGAVRVWAW
jgi:hypothetical protein